VFVHSYAFHWLSVLAGRQQRSRIRRFRMLEYFDEDTTMVACQPVHSYQACLYCNHCRTFDTTRYPTHLHCLLVVARAACPVPCVCLAFTSSSPSTCSNQRKANGWSWQAPIWMAAAMYTVCLNSSRSKEKNFMFSSFWMGELLSFASCFQGHHSLLHTRACHLTST